MNLKAILTYFTIIHQFHKDVIIDIMKNTSLIDKDIKHLFSPMSNFNPMQKR